MTEPALLKGIQAMIYIIGWFPAGITSLLIAKKLRWDKEDAIELAIACSIGWPFIIFLSIPAFLYLIWNKAAKRIYKDA